jgi:hypothetical protein
MRQRSTRPFPEKLSRRWFRFVACGGGALNESYALLAIVDGPPYRTTTAASTDATTRTRAPA